MIKKMLLLIATIATIALSFSTITVNAAPSAKVFSAAKNLSIDNILKVHYPRRRSCAYWRDRCGYHHSYADYDWCLRDRGCGRYSERPRRPVYNSYPPRKRRYPAKRYRCRTIHKKCVRNWGRDNSDYFGCMRFHRCLLRNNNSRY